MSTNCPATREKLSGQRGFNNGVMHISYIGALILGIVSSVAFDHGDNGYGKTFGIGAGCGVLLGRIAQLERGRIKKILDQK